MSDVPETAPSGNAAEGGSAAPAVAPAIDADTFRQELDARLAQQRQELTQQFGMAMNQLVETIRQSMPAATPTAGATQPLITAEELANNPEAALDKWDKAKRGNVAPASDPLAVASMAEVQIAKVRSRVSPEDWEKYSKVFEEGVRRAPAGMVVQEKGIDTIWRLTKSHVDDDLAANAAKAAEADAQRQGRIAQAQLGRSSVKIPNTPAPPKLSDEEAQFAEAMGIDPAAWKQYSDDRQEFEPGGKVGRV